MSSRRRREGGPLTAAGLVRFYEEFDVGIKLKPHVLIIVALVFAAVAIALSKVLPIS
ncbi:MAG: preprotein translocase subunit Sec61beta [Desulfurococcaceae archaeon]